jgi:TonB family protein
MDPLSVRYPIGKDMRVLLIVCFCGVAAADQAGDARTLLLQLADAASALTSFHAEGDIALEVNGKHTSDTHFNMAMKRPQYRRVSTEGASNTLSICDGKKRWFYLGANNSYTEDEATGPACSAAAMNWEQLLDGAQSVTPAGKAQVAFEGRQQRCQVVKVEYSIFLGLAYTPITPALRNAEHVKRTLCIDPVRKWVLQDRVETASAAGTNAVTTTYRLIELNPDLPLEVFVFHPPAGSSAHTGTGTGAPRPISGSSAPAVLVKKDPAYTEAAARDGIEGTVLLGLTVEPDGTPSNVHVVRSLQPDLDEKAIEAVGQWRFRPGTSNGIAVAVQATIEINFRLPKNQ